VKYPSLRIAVESPPFRKELDFWVTSQLATNRREPELRPAMRLNERVGLNATVEYDICGLLVYTAVASIPREGICRMRMAVIRSKDGSEPV
jgi:hypothetical protein